MSENQNKTQVFAFDRINFILLAIGMAIVIVGFILMSGPGSTETHYNADIFSTMRIKVAPVVCFVGFISMIYAVIRKPKDEAGSDDTKETENKNVAAANGCEDHTITQDNKR